MDREHGSGTNKHVSAVLLVTEAGLGNPLRQTSANPLHGILSLLTHAHTAYMCMDRHRDGQANWRDLIAI